MKIHGHSWSNNARRVQMLCEELKIPYSYDTVDLMSGIQYTPEFQKLNPNSKVPVIEDDGFVLWESQAIMRYLADKHQAGALYPKGLKERAIVDQWMDWNQTRLSPEASRIMYNLHFAGDKRDDAAIEKARGWLKRILPVMETALAKQPYLCGKDMTLADIAIAPTVAYLEICQYDLNPYPSIRRWYEAIKQRPSFAKTAPAV
jgi:glutathione S-transferase